MDNRLKLTAKKTIVSRPDNLYGGNLESNSSVNREEDKDKHARMPSLTGVAHGKSVRASGTTSATARSVPQSVKILSGPSNAPVSLTRGHRGDRFLSTVRSQDPARSHSSARRSQGNPVDRSLLPPPPHLRTLPTIIPPGPPLFGNKEQRVLPARTIPYAFERVGFFDGTPASARLRAAEQKSKYSLEKSRPDEYHKAPTLQNQQRILLRGPSDDHQQLVMAKRVTKQLAMKSIHSVPRKEDIVIKKEPELFLVPRKGARKHATTTVLSPEDIIEVESDEEPEIASNDFKGPSDDLVSAFKRLSLLTFRLQRAKRLPFLRRNLRVGFSNRCAQNNVETGGNKRPDPQVTVVYRLHTSSDGLLDEYKAQISVWLCPACDLHGRFKSREMLEKHFRWDHKEINIIWTQEGTHIWRIVFTILEPDDTAFSGSSSEATPDSPISTQQPDPIIIEEDDFDVKPTIHLKYNYLSSTQDLQSSFSKLLSQPSQSQPNQTAASQSTKDPLGPFAQAPYLPYGNVDFSCRPGGPKLYDLISTLPMEPFGVLSWYVIDKEEELFEVNDTRDEDKVMQALWSRWILLNRQNKFIPNYFEGTRLFIEEYLLMIHLAAGWSALRIWLFLLVKFRYITGPQVAQLLLHYERLVDEHQNHMNIS